MDLYILTTAADKSQAAVTSTTDDTPVSNLEQLVLGDSPEIAVRFTNGTAAPAWAGDSDYAFAIGLGIPDVNGQANATAATDFSAISGGWQGHLTLSTQRLIDQMALAVGSAVDWTRYPMQTQMPRPRPYGGWFIMQIRVQDPDGNITTYAELRVFVRNRVLPASVVTTGSDEPPVITLEGAITGTSNTRVVPTAFTRSYNASTNSAGDTTVTPDGDAIDHTEIVTFSGSAGTRNVLIDASDLDEGYHVIVRLALPATAGIVVNIYQDTAAGTLLTTVTTDASGDDLCAEYVFDGTNLKAVRTAYPA